MRGWFLEGRVVVFAWVLNVHHHALFGDDRTTGFRGHWDGQEAADFTAVFALKSNRVQAVVAFESIAIRGDPQVAVSVECQVVRAGNRGDLGLVEPTEVGFGLCRITTDQQQVPGELLAGVLVVDLHDQPVLVLPDWCVLGWVFLVLLGIFAGSAAVLVVRQRDIH